MHASESKAATGELGRIDGVVQEDDDLSEASNQARYLKNALRETSRLILGAAFAGACVVKV